MNIDPIGVSRPGLSTVSAAPMTMTSPPPTAALNGTLSGIAQGLGMSMGDVQSALRQGGSISGLAAQQGVSRQALISSVQSQIQNRLRANGLPAADQDVLDRMVGRAFDRPGGSARTGG
ncbi:MAG TPA: hypothetical protein VFN65_09355 [Solirubrobacteraceae bacterium]|nr:hypothetical protein [Solirubrobacteraceae bacterium]